MFSIVDYTEDKKRLCEWLRDNSSGVYRPAAIAANVIESLQEKVQELRKLLEQQSSEDVADRSIYILSECSWGDFDIRSKEAISAHFTEESAMKGANTRGLPVSPPEDDSNWCEIKKVELVS